MRFRTWVAVSIALSVTWSVAPAAASCLAPPSSVEDSLATAELVFVGTVAELNNRNRWATFAVHEVWKGEPGSSRVEVRGGPPGGRATSVDRTFEIDQRYLVFAVQGDPHWEDNVCSATQPYDRALDRYRPASARTVATTTPPSEANEGVKTGTVVFAGVVLLVAVGGFFVVRRWGRNTVPS